jgi:hypothetical protein
MAVRIVHLRKHHPLVTPRIEFQAGPRPPLPLLTPRIEFDPDALVRVRRPPDGDNEGGHNKRRRLSFSGRHDGDDSVVPGDGDLSIAPGSSALRAKPAGEPGKPGSGGFSLENVLIKGHKWMKTDYDALHVRSEVFSIW